MANIRELKYKYGLGLKETIIKSFDDYDLNFKWESGWVDVSGVDSVKVTDVAGRIIINLMGFNSDIMSQLEMSDSDTLTKFILETIENYMDNKSSNKIYALYRLTSLKVYISEKFQGEPVLKIQINIVDPECKI